jgi:hypothetical protein
MIAVGAWRSGSASLARNPRDVEARARGVTVGAMPAGRRALARGRLRQKADKPTKVFALIIILRYN